MQYTKLALFASAASAAAIPSNLAVRDYDYFTVTDWQAYHIPHSAEAT